MTPVMIIIVMSNISIAMLTNIITRQQNCQTLKHPNVWQWCYQTAALHSLRPPTLAVMNRTFILTQGLWLFRFSSSGADDVLKVLWLEQVVPIVSISPTLKQNYSHIWSAVSSPQARIWLLMVVCVCTARENLGRDETSWSMYIC